jgi:chromosomal replication initiator protein
MTVERVDELLRDLVRDENSQQITVDQIQKVVSEYYDLSLADMSSRRRPASIAFPRQIAMYLTRQLTKLSLVEIGDAFGRRDHGTVIHACKKVKNDMDSSPEVKASVEKLVSALQR